MTWWQSVCPITFTEIEEVPGCIWVTWCHVLACPAADSGMVFTVQSQLGLPVLGHLIVQHSKAPPLQNSTAPHWPLVSSRRQQLSLGWRSYFWGASQSDCLQLENPKVPHGLQNTCSQESTWHVERTVPSRGLEKYLLLVQLQPKELSTDHFQD